MNPCPCGYYGDKSGRCHCRPEQIKRYQENCRGHCLIVLTCMSPCLPYPLATCNRYKLVNLLPQCERVIHAYQRQQVRQNKLNNELSPSELDVFYSIRRGGKSGFWRWRKVALIFRRVATIVCYVWRVPLPIWQAVITSKRRI